MSENITFHVLSGPRSRQRKPQRVRNPKRFGETALVLPPSIRRRAIRRRIRKEFRPHARPHYFLGRRLVGVDLYAEQAYLRPGPDPSDEISVETFALQPAGLPGEVSDAELRATLEAIVYVTEEPVTAQQIAHALELPVTKVSEVLEAVAAEFSEMHHGVSIRHVAGGYKMATKPEYHEGVRRFVRAQKPLLKLSMAALETLAVIAYKQPITSPEILEIRGVQGAGVLKTLLDKKLITTAGRKNVVGRPMMYKTTRDFLIQFGLNSVTELPTLREFEELKNMALNEAEEIEKAEVGRPRYAKYAEEAAAVDAYAVSSVGAESDGTDSDGADDEDASGQEAGATGSSGAVPTAESGKSEGDAEDEPVLTELETKD